MGVGYLQPGSPDKTFKTRTDTGEEVQAVDLEESAIVGAVDETAAASDTASSGLNGRLQRIAQRLTTLIGSTLTVGGHVAHDAADSGNPVKVGYRAIEYTAQSAIASGDRSDALCDRHGIPFVVGGHPDVIAYAHSAITTAVTDSAMVTVNSGSKIIVTGLAVTLDNASTVFPSVRIGFGTANVPALGNAGLLLAHGGVPAGGGVNRGDGSGIIGIGADGEDLRITTVGSATSNGLQVMVTYYVVPS